MSAHKGSPVCDLLLRARSGDRAALDQLFVVCRSYVRILAQTQVESWLRAKVDASDLAQQTLLDAYRGFDRFEGQTSGEWLAWLRRIVERNAADFVRTFHGAAKRQIGREVPLEIIGDWELPGADASPSQELLRKERELLLAEALAQLADDHREVILLRNLQRLPFDEVARRMGRSRPAVQMLWMRAIRKLQEVIAADSPSVEVTP